MRNDQIQWMVRQSVASALCVLGAIALAPDAHAASVSGSKGIEIEGPRDRRGLAWGVGLAMGGARMPGGFVPVPALKADIGAGLSKRVTLMASLTFGKYLGPSTGWLLGGDFEVQGFVFKGLYLLGGMGVHGVPRAKGDPVFTYGIGGEAGLGYEVFVNNTAAVSFGVNYDLRYAGEQAVRHGAFGVFKVRFY